MSQRCECLSEMSNLGKIWRYGTEVQLLMWISFRSRTLAGFLRHRTHTTKWMTMRFIHFIAFSENFFTFIHCTLNSKSILISIVVEEWQVALSIPLYWIFYICTLQDIKKYEGWQFFFIYSKKSMLKNVGQLFI